MEAWIEKYIGIPFKDFGRTFEGVDCWGLIYLVSKNEFDLLLPTYLQNYQSVEDGEELGRLIRGELRELYRLIKPGNEQPGDFVLLRLQGEPMHVGIVAGEGFMLHAMRGFNTALEKCQGIKWRSRILGFYKHV
jgi:cell wall-associated NlpC family hydrolase